MQGVRIFRNHSGTYKSTGIVDLASELRVQNPELFFSNQHFGLPSSLNDSQLLSYDRTFNRRDLESQYSSCHYPIPNPSLSSCTSLIFLFVAGLRYDDVLREETDIIREAIHRLPENEGYERVYRMKCAFQYSLSHTIATKDGTLKPEDDIRYLTPIIDEVAAEFAEKDDFNNIKSFTK